MTKDFEENRGNLLQSVSFNVGPTVLNGISQFKTGHSPNFTCIASSLQYSPRLQNSKAMSEDVIERWDQNIKSTKFNMWLLN